MTDNKELIPGMTDIVNHIKKIEKENKELKEKLEDKKDKITLLKQENDELKEEINVWIKEQKGLSEENKELKEYVKININLRQIKEIENEKLKKLDTEAVDIISKLNQEKEELKEENEAKDEQIAELEEEVSSAIAPENVCDWIQDDGEYKVMKTEEVNTLKEEIEGLRNKLDIATEERMAEMKKINIFYDKKKKEWEEDIEKLKEEVEKALEYKKKLQDIIGELNCEKEKIIKDLSDRVDYGFKEIEKYKTSNMCNGAILDYAGNYAEIEDMKEFNDWLKEQTFLAKNYSEENYKKMYDWFDMEELLKDE